MSLNINKKYFFKFFLYLCFLVVFVFKPNYYVLAMNNSNDTETSSSGTNRNRLYKIKSLKLTESAKKIQKKEGLSHQISTIGNNQGLLNDILQSVRLNLNHNQHLGITSLNELNQKFSQISIKFEMCFNFYKLSELLYHNPMKEINIEIPLEDFEILCEENILKLKLKKNSFNTRNKILNTFGYDTQKNQYVGSKEHYRWNADIGVLDYIVDIEIEQLSDENIPIKLIFKTYSYTSSPEFFFNVYFVLKNIHFIRK